MSSDSISIDYIKKYIENNEYDQAIKLINKKYKNNLYCSFLFFFNLKQYVKTEHTEKDIFNLIMTVCEKSNKLKSKKNYKETKNYYYKTRYKKEVFSHFFEAIDVLGISFNYLEMYMEYVSKKNNQLFEIIFNPNTRTMNDGFFGSSIWEKIIDNNLLKPTIDLIIKDYPSLFKIIKSNQYQLIDLISKNYRRKTNKDIYKDIKYINNIFKLKDLKELEKNHLAESFLSEYHFSPIQKINLIDILDLDYSSLSPDIYLNLYIAGHPNVQQKKVNKYIDSLSQKELIQTLMSLRYQYFKKNNKKQLSVLLKTIQYIFHIQRTKFKDLKISQKTLQSKELFSKSDISSLMILKKYNLNYLEIILLVLLDDLFIKNKIIEDHIKEIFKSRLVLFNKNKIETLFRMLFRERENVFKKREPYSTKSNYGNTVLNIVSNTLIEETHRMGLLTKTFNSLSKYSRYELSCFLWDYKNKIRVNKFIFKEKMNFDFYEENIDKFIHLRYTKDQRIHIVKNKKYHNMNMNMFSKEIISKKDFIKHFSKTSNIDYVFSKKWIRTFLERDIFEKIFKNTMKLNQAKYKFLISLLERQNLLRPEQIKKTKKELYKDKISLLKYLHDKINSYSNRTLSHILKKSISKEVDVETIINKESLRTFIKKEIFIQELRNE